MILSFVIFSCSPERIEPSSEPAFGASTTVPQSVEWTFDNQDSIRLEHDDEYPKDSTIDTVFYTNATTNSGLWLPGDTAGFLSNPDVVLYIDGADYDHYNGDSIELDSISGWTFRSGQGYEEQQYSLSDVEDIASFWIVIDNINEFDRLPWIEVGKKRCDINGWCTDCLFIFHSGTVCAVQLHFSNCFVSLI